MDKEIDRIVREFIPHKDSEYILDLIRELTRYMTDVANKNFNEGVAFDGRFQGKES